MDVKELERKVQEIKLKCLKLCIEAGQGHVTSAFSCAEMVVALYYRVMKYDTSNLQWQDRDRFVMSKNHASVILYPILQDIGFINKDEKIDFMKDGSNYGGHSKENVPGIEFAGGSLGIGLGVACGMAYSAKMQRKNHRVFVVVGDGECYEGGIWESIMFAGHNKLSNLVMLIDRNQMAITDYTENMLQLEPLEDKLRAFNWAVKSIDGHNISELLTVLEGEKDEDKPFCIICNTIKGNGVSGLSNKMYKHGVVPKGKDAEMAIEEIERAIKDGD